MGADRRVFRLRDGKAAGIATSGSLIAAAVCLVALVSAYLAFDAWPEGAASSPHAEVRLAAPPASDAPVRLGGETARRSGDRDRRAARARTARRASGRRRSRADSRSGRSRTRSTRPVRRPATTALAPVATQGPAATPQPQRTVVQGTARQVASTVRSTGRTTGETVGGVSPVAGEVVTGTTEQVAGAVDAAATLLP